MCLNVLFTFIVILSNQCLMLYSFRIGLHKDLSEIETSGLNDCSLRLPDENDLETPIPSTLNSEAHLITFPVRNGHLNIKHNSYLKLSCPIDKHLSAIDKNTREITVKCLKGRNLEYNGQKYSFGDLKCENVFGTAINNQTYGDCCIRVSPRDFTWPVPYIKTRRPTILRPDLNGRLNLKRNTAIQLTCTSRRFQWPKLAGIREITVRCFRNNLVTYENETYTYDQFRCDDIPQARLIMTSHKCQYNNSVASVGFNTRHKFLILYNICFDMVKKTPLYSWYFAQSPHYSHGLSFTERPIFVRSKQYFGDIDMHSVYKDQAVAVLRTLKTKELMKKYINVSSEHFLARGHLVARTEFAYGFEQEATFFYENSAPTWQYFNKNIWGQVEKYISKRLSKGTSSHVVVAGTYGTCTLPDKDNIQRPLYLNYKQQNVPVPLFIWKMVYSVEKQESFVFIGLNDPYKKIKKSTFMCRTSQCPTALLQMVNPYRKYGLIYCCTKKNFERGYGERIHPIIFHRNLV